MSVHELHGFETEAALRIAIHEYVAYAAIPRDEFPVDLDEQCDYVLAHHEDCAIEHNFGNDDEIDRLQAMSLSEILAQA